jgi:hypothetical protein
MAAIGPAGPQLNASDIAAKPTAPMKLPKNPIQKSVASNAFFYQYTIENKRMIPLTTT